MLCARPVAAAEVVDRIVAVVNGDIITMFELNNHLKPMLDRFRGKELSLEEKKAIAKMREDILDKLVDEMLLKQQVEKLKLSATKVEVDQALETFRKRNGLDKEQFAQELKLEGMTMDEFREKIRDDILKHRLLGFMVRRKVVVSDEEAKAYYEEHKQDYVQDKKVGLSVILAPNILEARQLAQRLEKGELTFDDAARLYSQGPNPEQGGDMGKLAWRELAPDWRSALDGLEVGDISEPFAFRAFGAILKVNDLSGGEVAPFESVAEEIREKLFQEQAEERFEEYMDKLRSEAVIEIKL